MNGPSQRTRVFVITADVVAEQMAGPAIRAWHLAEQLAGEHDVRFASTTRCELTHPAFATSSGPTEIDDLVEWCDVVVLQGWVMHDHPSIGASSKVVVVDAYDPMHLEQLEQARDLGGRLWGATVMAATVVMSTQLARADFILCASEEQRMLWLGHLAAIGRVNPEVYEYDRTYRSFIDVVPFGLPSETPQPTGPAMRGVLPGIGADDQIVLWNGGVYNWFDPLTLVQAVARLTEELPRLRLVFMGMKHPNPDVPAMRVASETVQLAESLGLVGRSVYFNESWVPFDRRYDFLSEADIVVSTHLPGLETDFAYRTRVLDAIWAGLPMVLTEGGPLSNFVDEQELGLVIPPSDVDALADALRRLLVDDELRAATAERVAATATTFHWAEVARPLLEFCRSPHRAADFAVPDKVDDRRYDLGIAYSMHNPWLRRIVRAAYLADQRGIGAVVSTVRSRLRGGASGSAAPE